LPDSREAGLLLYPLRIVHLSDTFSLHLGRHWFNVLFIAVLNEAGQRGVIVVLYILVNGRDY
jgi:predicted MPP superfamily phosphohydrolase